MRQTEVASNRRFSAFEREVDDNIISTLTTLNETPGIACHDICIRRGERRRACKADGRVIWVSMIAVYMAVSHVCGGQNG